MSAFKIGDLVAKVGGYPFPGRIIGRATTSAGAERFNVESTVLPGLIHIFNASQLARDDGAAAIRVALDTLKREGVDVVAALNALLSMALDALESEAGRELREADLPVGLRRARAALAKLEGRCGA